MGTQFGSWLRELGYPLNSRRISVHNLDYIFHNYRENWFITLEEKRKRGRVEPSQDDTHFIVVQLLEAASGTEVLSSMREDVRHVEYRGHYIVVFENTTPDDSKWIRVTDRMKNEMQIVDTDGLLYLLTTGSLPSVFLQLKAAKMRAEGMRYPAIAEELQIPTPMVPRLLRLKLMEIQQ